MYLSKYMVRRLLPEVGEKRIEMPSYGIGAESVRCRQPQECTVVAVHPAHLWYRVRFDASGWHECYKVPQLSSDTSEGVIQ